ncbi:MAG: RHS repeat-associated core domain-containing protein [Nitrospirales bacterium]
MRELGGASGPDGGVIVAAGTVSPGGQGGALNGFRGFMPTGQGGAVGPALGGGTSVVRGADPGGGITTVGSGGAGVIGGGLGGSPAGGPPDETVARLVTAPLAVIGAHGSSYDAYGNIVDQTGTVEQPYTYTGREFDSESGLYYYRARYYDPATGRFLQKDPIGLGGGDVNFYNFVRNNPPRLADPFGLFDLATPSEVLNFWGEFYGGISDFGANYVDMRQARWIGSDKYFHCKANCQAAQRGVEGEAVACTISDIREWWDQNVKSYWDPRSTPQDSAADQQANLYGRLQGSINPGTPCEQSCTPFRPTGLPPQY